MLAPQQSGCHGSGFPKGLASGVKDIPLALDVALVGHKSGHRVEPPIKISLPYILRRAGGFSRFTKGLLLLYNAGETTGRCFQQATL